MNHNNIARRDFLRQTAIGSIGLLAGGISFGAADRKKKPNLVFLLADQWRAQATGYAGDPNAQTPILDKLAAESVNFTTAVSTCPVCSPYRASLLTGRYPLSHGVFLNDLCLNTEAVSFAQAYNQAGYAAGFIGKWHLDGHGRSNFIPRERRQGFSFWKVLECTHNYNDSRYYGDDPKQLKWNGYDAIAQTTEAVRYIKAHQTGKPFALFVSWGPPHAPYHTAPSKYRARFNAEDVVLRDNVPADKVARAKKDLAGYYAHIAVLDDCVDSIVKTLRDSGLADDTILVFTADHGDMLYSHGRVKKQQPQDESIRVPFLLRYPAGGGKQGKEIDMPIGTPDIMPTILGLSGLTIPKTVEGHDYSGVITGTGNIDNEAELIMCPSPFGQWQRKIGGREYRGLRTRRYTYARDLNGPWLLFDNEKDPYQLKNLCNQPTLAAIQAKLDNLLSQKLKETKDKFISGWDLIKKWDYEVDESGTVPYWKKRGKTNPA